MGKAKVEVLARDTFYDTEKHPPQSAVSDIVFTLIDDAVGPRSNWSWEMYSYGGTLVSGVITNFDKARRSVGLVEEALVAGCTGGPFIGMTREPAGIWAEN